MSYSFRKSFRKIMRWMCLVEVFIPVFDLEKSAGFAPNLVARSEMRFKQ
jgi:hypothetical protein